MAIHNARRPGIKLKPNPGHYVEGMDRIDVVQTMMEEILKKHISVVYHPDVLALVEEAADKLGAAYQLLGEKE